MTAGDPRTRFPFRSNRAPEACGCGLLAIREIDAILTSGNAAPTIANVAARLSMNVRTLQRCLADEELVFRDLLRERRRQHAIEALTAGALSIAAIARQLGYSDSAHFARAFRTWTGRSPSAYQNAARDRSSY